MIFYLNILMENKKIKNARSCEYNGITFKSKLEESFYKTLVNEGFDVRYEELKFILIEGFQPTVDFYHRSKSKVFKKEMSKIRPITYTPDFTFTHDDILFIIEAKGIENDTFPLKRKLFRRYIEINKLPCVYFEIHTKKDLLHAIEIIKNYGLSSRDRIES